MLSVRLAKEAHLTQAAEDKEVLGQRSIIPLGVTTKRLGVPTKRRARAVSRRFALGTFQHASPRRLQNCGVALALEVARVRSRYPYTRLNSLSRNGVPQTSASESRKPRRPGRGLPDGAGVCWSLIRVIGFNVLLLTLACIVVEFVFTRRILYQGLPAESGSEPTALYWIARLLSYLLVAFLAACATTSLLAAASDARWTIPCPRSSVALLPASDPFPSMGTPFCLKNVRTCDAYPRAPPITTRNGVT